jgi:hypothetical protein
MSRVFEERCRAGAVRGARREASALGVIGPLFSYQQTNAPHQLRSALAAIDSYVDDYTQQAALRPAA